MVKNKITIRKINELMKDEKMGYREYQKLAEANPEFIDLFGMADDENRHYHKLAKIKKKLQKKKEKIKRRKKQW